MEKKSIIKSIGINLIFLLGYIFIFSASLNNNADIYMEYMVSGACGKNYEYLIFSNILYGKILKYLYVISPEIAWYGLFQYAFIFISFLVITYRIFCNYKGEVGYIINVIILMTFGYECFGRPEYVKTALLMCVSIYFGILFNNSKTKLQYAFGCIWLFLSFLLSARVFFVITIICLAIEGINIILGLKRINYIDVIVMIIVILCVQGANLYDYHVYENAEGLNKVNECRSDLVQLYDYGWPTYDDLEWFQVSDISIEYYRALKENQFTDIKIEKLQEITGIRNDDMRGMYNVIRYKNVEEFFSNGLYYIVVIMFGFLLLSKTEKKWVYVTRDAFIFILLVFSMYYFAVDMSSWMPIAIALIVSLNILQSINTIDVNTVKNFAFPYLVVIMNFVLMINQSPCVGDNNWKAEKEDWLEAKYESTDTQYIYDISAFVKNKPLLENYPSNISEQKNVYLISCLTSLYSLSSKEAFDASVMKEYEINSYWCNENTGVLNLYETVKEKYGYSTEFWLLNFDNDVAIYQVIGLED